MGALTQPQVPAKLTPTGRRIEYDRFEQYIRVSGPTSTVETHLPKAELPSGRPTTILFGALCDPRFRIKRAIALEISSEGGAVIAHSPDVDEFGYGPSLSAALDDFGRTLLELYVSLEENQSRLADDLVRIRTKLDEYLERR